MVYRVIFAHFGNGIAPAAGQSTIVLANCLKIFISIKIEVPSPNLHIIEIINK